MVDQFGKDIVITYKGADRLKAFKEDVTAVRNVLNGLVRKAGEMKQVSDALRTLTAKTLVEEHKEFERALKREVAELKRQLQMTKTLAGEEASLQRARQARENRILTKRKQRLQIAQLEARIRREEVAGINRLADRERKLASDRMRFAAAQKKAQEGSIRRTRIATGATNKHTGAIQAAIGRTIRFFVLFRAVQEGIQLAGKSITESLDFAALLEESQVQIAGLIVSVSDLTDEFGNTLDAAAAMPVALSISKDILSQLQKDAVLTASTFQDLVTNLQVAVAPGVSNGLDLDQVRQLTVTFSQAATALGLEQRQLAEEIRSTLQGTITARNTRIATSLGITNEDIRQAKDAGRLFEFLEERMAGIAGAATLLQGSLSLLRSNFFDLLQIAGATGIQPVFEQLKGLFGDLINLFDEGTLEDGVQIEPAVIDTMQLAAEGLAAIVESFREFIQTDDAGETVRAVALALKSLGESISESLPGLLEAVAGAVRSLSVVAASFLDVLSLIPGELLAVFTAMVAILPVIKAFTTLVTGLGVALSGVKAAALAGSLTGLIGALPILGAAVLAGTLLFGDFGKGLSEAEKESREADKSMRLFAEGQDRIRAKAVTLTSKLKDESLALTELAAKFREANEELRLKGLSDEQKAGEQVQAATEEDQLKLARTRISLEQDYKDAVKASGAEMQKLPQSLREAAEANARLLAVASEVTGKGNSEERDAQLKEAVKDMNDAFSGAAVDLAVDRIFEDTEKRLKPLEDKMIDLLEADRVSPRAIDNTQRAIELIQKQADNRIKALRSGEDTASSEYRQALGEIGQLTEGAAGALRDQEVLSSQILRNGRREIELLEASKALEEERLETLRLRVSEDLKDSENGVEKLKRRLSLEQSIDAAEDDQGKSKRLQEDFHLQEKQIPLLRERSALEAQIASVLDSDLRVSKNQELLELLFQRSNQLTDELELLKALSDIEKDRLEDAEKAAAVEAERKVAGLREQLRIAQALTDTTAGAEGRRTGADTNSLLAGTAQERRDAAREVLDIELAINQEVLNGLAARRIALGVGRALTFDEKTRLERGLEIEDLRQQINESLNTEKFLKADLLRLERETREETEIRAGLAKGLNDAADQRGLGAGFQQVGQTFADSLGEGIRTALLSGDTGAAIDAFALKMETAVLDALINGLIVAPVTEFFGNLLGGGAGDSAELAAQATATGSLTSLAVAANLASSALISTATSGAVSKFTPSFVPGTIFPFMAPISGNADGGPVPAPNMPRSLPGHHPGDTTILAAQQGEFIFNKKTSLGLGHAFLNSINSGMLSGAQARAAIAARIHRNNGPIKGYDLGGPVGSTTSGGTSFAGGRRRSRGGRSVLFPVTQDSANTILSNPMLGPNLAANKASLGLSDREYI